MFHEEAALAPHVLRRMYERTKIDPICCAFCRKFEPWEKSFPQCAGCNLAVYCSRECQKSHWKIHKSSCLDAQKKGFGVSGREMNKLRSRVGKFRLFYAPLLDFIVLYRYSLYNKTIKGEGRPKNHIVEICLRILPDGLRKPRLEIDKILLREMCPNERRKAGATARREKYFLPYTCTTPDISTFQTMSCNGDMMEKIQESMQSKADLLKRITHYVQTINVIANGLRPDLFEIIAEFMK